MVERLGLVTPATRFPEDRLRPKLQVSSKVRSIDPLVATDGEAFPLSVLDREFGHYRAEYHASKRGAYALGIVPG